MAKTGWTRGPFGEGGGGGEPPLRMLPVPPRPNLAQLRTIAIVIGLVVLFFTSYYQVEPDEVGVVQRFGTLRAHDGAGPALEDPVRRRDR